MLSLGNNIISASDKLIRMSLTDVHSLLKRPKPEVLSRIRQLRIAYEVDRKRYDKSKRYLPYLVCGVFNPPFRRTENFSYLEYFILDIDHVSSKGLNILELKGRIEKDGRVVMSFLSPSEDGLKIIFKLKERCTDTGVYSLFYKIFAQSFSSSLGLEQVVDSRTCDVCRACFMSYDENAYFNPDAECVDLKDFLPVEDTSALLDMKKEFVFNDAANDKQKGSLPSEKAEKEPLDEELGKIREILKLNRAKKQKPPVYVPQQLIDVIDDVSGYVEKTGIHIYEIINISYGKKLKLILNQKLAEINIFYGKRGFTVTITPKNGTDGEFNELCRDLVNTFLLQL